MTKRTVGPALVVSSLGIDLPDDIAFIADKGRGVLLFASNGKEYLDYVMGYGPLILGHSHPEVLEAVSAQLSKGAHFYAPSHPAMILAERIVELVPSAEMVQFAGSGAEATFYALRLARAYTGRTKILKFEGAYHGHHDYAMHGFRPRNRVTYPFVSPDSAGIPAEISKTVLVAPFNDLEKTSRLIEQYGPIAAVIVEPVQRAIMPVAGFLEGLRKLCEETGALLVFDEVVTGFRLSLGGAQEAFGVIPDLTVLGKALGGGFPIAALTGPREIIELSSSDPPDPARAIHLSGTLNGNPLSAVAGLATLEVLEREKGCNRMATAGNDLKEGLLDLGVKLGIPLQIIGPPSLPEPIFGEGQIRDQRSYLSTNREGAKAFGMELIRQGVYVKPGGKWFLSAVHENRHIDQTLEAAERALVTVRDAGLFEP